MLTDAGASVMKILFRGRVMTAGFETAEEYLDNGVSFYGATVGRYANRIGNAEFSLNGTKYSMDRNDGANCLHSGFSGWFSRIWDAKASQEKVVFSLHSPDGDQGMPGAAEVSVSFSLNDDNELHIRYDAVADADTFFNLTNHSYFNLGGTHADHLLKLEADRYAEVNADLIPTGRFLPVDGHMDFRTARPLDNSYDNSYELKSLPKEEPFADVFCKASGIGLRAYTDLPAVQLYTGNGDNFCLETQYQPDTPNHPVFPSCLFRAGERFNSETVYQFYDGE